MEENREHKGMNITAFARLCQVTVRTLKYYEEMGLLKPARIEANGYRVYEYSQIDEVSTIIMLKDQGFKLSEIKKVLSTSDLSELTERFFLQKRLVEEKLKRLNSYAERISYVCEHLKLADERMGEPFFSQIEDFFFSLFPLRRTKENDERIIINYLIAGERSGVVYAPDDFDIPAGFRQDPEGCHFSGTCLNAYARGGDLVEKRIFHTLCDYAREHGYASYPVFIEAVYESRAVDECVIRYFIPLPEEPFCIPEMIKKQYQK